MKIKAVLFDLDGTLLPMDQDEFVKVYFGLLARWMAAHGYEAKAIVGGVMAGIEAMVRNDGSVTNEVAFWDCFAGLLGDAVREEKRYLEEFYRKEFRKTREGCGFRPEAKEVVALAGQGGRKVVLATNPLFPSLATEQRIDWAGLSTSDFEWFTTYENSSHCKPNPNYYREVLDKIGCVPEECLMIGNDVAEDMVAETLGMKVFLLTDHLINKKGADIDAYPHGGFAELKAFLENLE